VIRYNWALVELARDDRPAALAELRAARDCGHAQARDLYDRLRVTRGDTDASRGNIRPAP
jgi:hypothetical protein